jgi:uncharacterized delta-60 repeat protein/uncharacterized repeat protein (TIGR01451 family)
MHSVPSHRRRSLARSRRPPHRRFPTLEALEERRLLSFDLHNGVLKESFDDLGGVTVGAWNDNQSIPPPPGSGQGYTPTNIPLFHHDIVADGGTPSANVGPGGTTSFQGLPSQELDLANVDDGITFPGVDLQTEAVSIADLDVKRESAGSISVTFIGTGGRETLTDPFSSTSSSEPTVITGQGTGQGTGPGSIGIVPPTVNGWDTLAATSDDVLPSGTKLGPIVKILVVASGQTAALDNVRIAVAATAGGSGLAPGALDPTFGQSGQVTTLAGFDARLGDHDGAGALQPDGKIIVVGGGLSPEGASTLALVRYSADGQPETPVYLDGRFQIDTGVAVAVNDNTASADYGKIIVAGDWTDEHTGQEGVALVRFHPDLTLDTSFGTGGVMLDHRLTDAYATALLLQPDGTIWLGGNAFPNTAGGVETAFVERFRPDGSPDVSFGNQGVLTSVLGGTDSTMGGLARESNGAVLMAGVQTSGRTSTLALAQFTPGGQLDPSFGTGGIRTTAVTNIWPHTSVSVAIDPTRGIVIGGSIEERDPSVFEDFFAVRFDLQGNLDPSFNHGQAQRITFQHTAAGEYSQANAVVVQPDGKILVAGKTAAIGDSAFALARLNADGSPDTGFGTNGLVVTPIDSANSFYSTAWSVLVQSDGDIVLTGNSVFEFAVARYIGNVTTTPIPQYSTASNVVYELPQGARPGQSFPSSQIAVANHSGASVLDGATAGTAGATLHAHLVQGPADDPTFHLNDDGTFTYTPDAGFSGTDHFTFVANDGTSDSNVAWVTIVTQGSPHDTDGDGVPDVVEAFAPNGGSFIRGGTPDYLLPNVASLVGADGQYWTLVTGDGTFSHVTNEPTPQVPALPGDVSLPAGLFSFQVQGVTPGSKTVVTMTPASSAGDSTFYELDTSTNTWSDFPLDTVTGIGADVGPAGVVTLHLVDGGRGDEDAKTNGIITVVGGPASVTGTPFAKDLHQSVPHHAQGSITIPTGASQLNGAPVQLVLLHGQGNDPLRGSVTVDQNSGTFTYTSNFNPVDRSGAPLPGWSDLIVNDSFAYQVVLNGHLSPVAHVFLEPADSTPAARNYQFEVYSGLVANPIPLGDLLQAAQAADPDGDPLRVIAPAVTGFGTLTPDANGDGGFTYQHDPSKIFPAPSVQPATQPGLFHDTFTVDVVDPYGAKVTASIDLSFDEYSPIAPPDLVVPYTFGVAPDFGVDLQNRLGADPTNPLVDPITQNRVTGAVVVAQPTDETGQPDGKAWIDDWELYYVGAKPELGSVTLSYATTDGFAYSPAARLTIQVNLVPPTLVSDVYSTPKNTMLATGNVNKDYDLNGMTIPITQPGPVANDVFPNGVGIEPAVTEVWAIDGPQHGTLASTFSNNFASAGGGDLSGDWIRLEDHTGGFLYQPDSGFVGWDRFSYDVSFGPTLVQRWGDFATREMTVLIHVTDQGEVDTNVVSLADSAPDHAPVTIAAPAGTTLVQAQAIPNPSPSDAPPVDFPFGILSFAVAGLPAGGLATVTLTVPAPLPDGFTYYKYGPTPGNAQNHWYPFPFDPASGIGAKTHWDDPSIPLNEVVLYLRDGDTGDDDIDGLDGVIVDPGGIGIPAADLAISQAAAPAAPSVGQDLTFTLTVTNRSSIPDPGVVVTDPLPSGVAFVSAASSQGTCAFAGGSVQCSLGTLPPGASATIRIVVRPTAPGTLTNTARVSGTLFDPVSSDDVATATVTAVPAGPLQRFVTTLYVEVLDRFPEPQSLDYWVGRLKAGMSRRRVARAIFDSPEHRKLVRQNLAPHLTLRRAFLDAVHAERSAEIHPGTNSLRGHRAHRLSAGSREGMLHSLVTAALGAWGLRPAAPQSGRDDSASGPLIAEDAVARDRERERERDACAVRRVEPLLAELGEPLTVGPSDPIR